MPTKQANRFIRVKFTLDSPAHPCAGPIGALDGHRRWRAALIAVPIHCKTTEKVKWREMHQGDKIIQPQRRN